MEKEITYTKDQATLTVTQLQYFRDVGFSIDHLVGILANIGGSHNLAALGSFLLNKDIIKKELIADADFVSALASLAK